jgi:hypothetical protein
MEPAIDDEAAFGEPRDHIGIAEAVAHGVAHRQGNDILRKPVV